MSKRAQEPATLANQLRDAIRQSEYSLNAIATAAGLPQLVLHRFVSGKRDVIRLDTADKLCELLVMRLTKPKKIHLKCVATQSRSDIG